MTTVHYQFSGSEAVNAILKVRRWNHPWEIIKGTVAGVLGAALIVGVYVLRDRGRRPGLAMLGFGMVVCMTPILYFITRLRVRRSITRQVRNNPSIDSPEELSFDDQSLTLSSASRRQEFSWSVFPGRKQDERYFYLFSGAGGVFMIVPKRAFDADKVAEFLRCSQLPQTA